MRLVLGWTRGQTKSISAATVLMKYERGFTRSLPPVRMYYCKYLSKVNMPVSHI